MRQSSTTPNPQGDTSPTTESLTPEREQEIAALRYRCPPARPGYTWVARIADERDLDRQATKLDAARADLLAEVERLRARVAELDKACDDLIDERDRAHDMADKLAYAVAPIEVIGEHSSHNCPWENALELVTPFAEVEKLRARVAELEKVAVEGRAALGALCFDLEDPGSNAFGALYLLSQATVHVDAQPDDAANALARHDAQVLHDAAQVLEDTDRDDDAVNLLYTLARAAQTEGGGRGE